MFGVKQAVALVNIALAAIKHIAVWMCLGLLLSGQVGAAQPVLDVTQVGREPISLTQYFAVLEDPGAALTLTDVTTRVRQFPSMSASKNQ